MRKYTSLVALAVAAMAASAGCVDADPAVLATAHVLGDCDTEGGLTAVNLDGDIIFTGQVYVDLAQVSDGGTGQTVGFQTVSIEGPDGMREDQTVAISQTGAMGINFSAQNQLLPTTEYTSVGYDSEMRVDQNQFLMDTVLFDVTDSPAPYTLNDVPYTALNQTGGNLWVGNAAMLGPQKIAEWSEITTAVAGNNSIVPVTVEAQLSGQLVDGTAAESNVVRLELLVCNGCGIGTTPLCQLSQ
jgi:hypothetical protein